MITHPLRFLQVFVRIFWEISFSWEKHSYQYSSGSCSKSLPQQKRKNCLNCTLMFTEVPLDDVFVPLRVIPDRPIFDIPFVQERQLKHVWQCTDLSEPEGEDYIRRLRFIWYSQLRPEEARPQQQISIDEVLQRISPENSMAIILGAPGSDKTTLLHWTARRMAEELIATDGSPAGNGSSSARIPILIND